MTFSTFDTPTPTLPPQGGGSHATLSPPPLRGRGRARVGGGFSVILASCLPKTHAIYAKTLLTQNAIYGRSFATGNLKVSNSGAKHQSGRMSSISSAFQRSSLLRLTVGNMHNKPMKMLNEPIGLKSGATGSCDSGTTTSLKTLRALSKSFAKPFDSPPTLALALPLKGGGNSNSPVN